MLVSERLQMDLTVSVETEKRAHDASNAFVHRKKSVYAVRDEAGEKDIRSFESCFCHKAIEIFISHSNLIQEFTAGLFR